MKCGVARRKITPDHPVYLSGYGSRNEKSRGVYQDIHVKALAMENSGLTVIVTSDLLYYDDDILAPVEAELAQNPGLNPDQILFTATHTHCAPTVRVTDGEVFGERDPEFIANLKQSLVNVVREAVASLTPADIACHRGTCDININRRVKTEHGIAMRPNPEGPADRDVDILAIHAEDGSRMATLFTYACHATTMGGYHIGGDYPGFAQEYLERQYPGSIALFMQGCAGDVRPNNVENGGFRSGPLEVVEEFGNRLGRSVSEALETEETRVDGAVSSSDVIAQVQYMSVPTRAELEAAKNDESEYVRNWAELMVQKLDAGKKLPTYAPVHVQSLRIGNDFALVAMAGEICVEIGLAIKAVIGDGPRMVIGYTNRSQGYIPSKSIHPEGGYEVDGAFYWEGAPAPYTENAEQTLVETARQALEG